MNEKMAEFLGIMFGDGCLSHTGKSRMIYISGHKQDDLEYHQKITLNLLKELFNKDARIEFKNKENTLLIRFSDKNIFEYLSHYLPIGTKYTSLKLLPELKINQLYFFSFLNGLVSTDGCIVFSKQHKQLAYYPRIEI